MGEIDSVLYFEQTLDELFPVWVPEDKRIVIVAQLYTGYLDESGTHDPSDFVVVAGFVSNKTKWVTFWHEWKVALERWGIPTFHMTDFEAYQGDFRGWSTEKHKDCINELLGIIKKHTFLGIGFIIRTKQFDEMVSEAGKKLCGNAYGFAAIGCWHNLSILLQKPKTDGYINWIMGQGSKGSDAVLKIFNAGSKDSEWIENNRVRNLTIGNNQDHLPLQAADILAYEINKEAQWKLGGLQLKDRRYPLKQLAAGGRLRMFYADDDEIKKDALYLDKLLLNHEPED